MNISHTDTGRGSGPLTVHSSIHEVGAERWDRLAIACGAPVFYRSAFLDAFERFPLHDVDRSFYLTGQDDQSELTFGLPCYLTTGQDPMRVLADHVPDLVDQPALMSHAWHCYDTWLLGRPPLTHRTVATVVQAMADLADDVGAGVYGFHNVGADNQLARLLDDIGVSGLDVDCRFTGDLAAYPDVEGFLSQARKKHRHTMLRMVRLAADAGAEVTVTTPADGDMDGFVALARAGAAKHGNADYYRPGIYQNFARALGQHGRLLETRHQGSLIGSALCLVDDTRYHLWTAGSDYHAIHAVSPLYLTLYYSLIDAFRSRKPVFEVGRRNEQFKRRYGMRYHTIRLYLWPVATRTPLSLVKE